MHIDKLISLYPASSLLGSQQQLTQPPVKSSTLPLRKMSVFRGVALWQQRTEKWTTMQQRTHLSVKSSTLILRKMPVFQGVAPWHTIFTSSCGIPLWDSTTVHSPFGKEVILSSLEESCFSGCVMFPHYPVWALFGLVLTHITHKIHVCIYTVCCLFI